MNIKLYITAVLTLFALSLAAQNNVAEEVAWVVGDEPIFKSDIEEQYLSMQSERIAISGNPYCVIPEQMAIDKLFLHQARIDTIEIHKDAIQKGQKVIIVDDLIATGGTLEAACKLVEELGGEVAGIVVVMELAGLKGREKLQKYNVKSLITYEGK